MKWVAIIKKSIMTKSKYNNRTPKKQKRGLAMSYNTVADYSKVLGGKNLPFRIELDELKSVLNPSLGSNQKYCYTITAVSGVSNTENMESFLLGIDPSITAGQIENIAVIINGSPRTVRFNTSSPNVRLTSAGLRFDFELSRNGGVMEISFELTSVYQVGPIPVSLYGDDASKTGLTIGGPYSLLVKPDPDKEKCFENANKNFGVKVFEISVPVSINPNVITHKPIVKCLGDLRIETGKKECHNKHERFDFTLSQKISVKTPVDFIVKTCYDKICVEECKDEEETGECKEETGEFEG